MNSNLTSRILFSGMLGIYLAVGMFLLVSASEANSFMLYKQFAHIALALGFVFLVSALPSSVLDRYSFLFYFSVICLLITVLVIGHTGKGAQRWINLYFLRFEPSELMKLALPLMLASYIKRVGTPIAGWPLIQCLVLILIPFLLIAKQPDLGTASIVGLIGILLLLLAGMQLRYFAWAGVLGLTSAPLTWNLLHDYQKARILTLLLPQNDTSGKGYHIMQAKIAIGAGGFFGQGWMRGTQSHLQFLPEHNTDFIFAVCAEEFGFIGCFGLLSLMLLISAYGFYLAAQAENDFCRLAIAGIISAYSLCSCINIAMVCGLIPVVGIPLPLISYGGTTMVVSMLGFACILSCCRQGNLFIK